MIFAILLPSQTLTYESVLNILFTSKFTFSLLHVVKAALTFTCAYSAFTNLAFTVKQCACCKIFALIWQQDLKLDNTRENTTSELRLRR